MPENRALFMKIFKRYCNIVILYSSLGGHSGDGSVSASGFFPHAEAKSAIMADNPNKIYSKKPLLVFIVSPLTNIYKFHLLVITRLVYQNKK